MVRLSEYMNDMIYPKELGLVVFGAVAQKYLDETKAENKLLEGLCPKRIILKDNWFNGNPQASVERAKAPHTAYAYYPPEYLCGKDWDERCSVFALFSIIYKLMSGKFPYIGNVPEELLSSKEAIKYIEKRRKDDLDLTCIPPAFWEFMAKGLMIDRTSRYKSIADTADDFSELAEVIHNCDNDDNPSVSDVTDKMEASDSRILISQTNPSNTLLSIRNSTEGSLDNIIGLQELKTYLRNRVIEVIKNPEKARAYKLSLPNGLLLYGPPGCGKTTIAENFASECNMNYAIVNPQDIASTYVHGTQKMVKQIFSEAERNAPIILILDEFATMVPSRNNPDMIKVAEDTNAFLSELNNCAKRGIFVIAISNRPQQMDSAVLRSGRFDKRVYVPLPDDQTRRDIFKAYLNDRPIEGRINYQALSSLTASGYISSDIRQICDEAAYKAFCEDTIITQALIEQVIHDGGPSVNRKELKTYEESRLYLDPSAHNLTGFNQIGFR